LLIVEDDERLATLLVDLVTQAGHTASVCPRGDEAVTRIADERPDLVVLDLTLPGLDGLDVCRQVRASYGGRILILTARGDEIDEIIGLELGADDYLSKPVAPRRLLARIGALLRRRDGTDEGLIRNGPLVVDPRRRAAHLGELPLELSTAEFDLLAYLVARAGQVVTRDELHQALRGVPYDGLDRSMDLRVSRLRKQLGAAWIKTVHGAGYLMPPVT
jgi:two-component system OmpR family response regulator/two-component system response regulator RstA